MAKTTTKQTVVREKTRETYDNRDFYGIVLQTETFHQVNSDGTESSGSTRTVLRADGTSHPDYCKALVLALARYGKLMELPYTIDGVSSAQRLTECMCIQCKIRWCDIPSERKILRGVTCPNGHSGATILTGSELSATDPELWYIALTDDNPPGKVSFRRGKEGYAQFREIVLPIDFRVYDDAKADEIRAAYVTGGAKKSDVDADLIIQGELGELGESVKGVRVCV